MYKKSILVVILLQIGILVVSAHAGHPEDQVIDGLDNAILTYLIIFVALVIIGIVAFIQGKKAAEEM